MQNVRQLAYFIIGVLSIVVLAGMVRSVVPMAYYAAADAGLVGGANGNVSAITALGVWELVAFAAAQLWFWVAGFGRAGVELVTAIWNKGAETFGSGDGSHKSAPKPIEETPLQRNFRLIQDAIRDIDDRLKTLEEPPPVEPDPETMEILRERIRELQAELAEARPPA